MPSPTSAASSVTNSAFMQTLARSAPRGSSMWVTAFPGTPDLTDSKNWYGKPYSVALNAREVDSWAALNTYYSVAALLPTDDGDLRRRKANFARLLVLVADDVDAGGLVGDVSYVLTTSPGKMQVGIFIDGNDPDAADKHLIGLLVTTMAEHGMMKADPSGNNAVRYVRLPVGQNQKTRESGPFEHHLEHWAPGVVLSLEDAAAVFGVDLDNLKAARSTQKDSSNSTAQITAQDERLRVLTANVLRGESLHDSVNMIAASLVASRMPGGAIVNLLRALLDASLAPKDERWLSRYQDIPRAVSTAEEKFRPQDEQQAAEPTPDYVVVPFDDLAHIEPPGPVYCWDGYIPVGVVTLLGAHGGTGKSTLALMLAVCTAVGIPLFGHATRQSNVLFFSGEDPAETVRHRLRKVCVFLGVRVADLAGKLHILDATGGNPVLYREDGSGRRGTGTLTQTYDSLRGYARQHLVGLVVVDNASDAYDASEIDRAKVRAFMRGLGQLAVDLVAGMLLLAHVDKSTARGMASGSDAYSGSTAWHNSARSRLFLSRDKDGSLLLEHQKHNLGKMREPLRLVWPEGSLPQVDIPQTGIVGVIAESNNMKAVIRLLHESTQLGRPVSTSQYSRSHAGKVLYRKPGFPSRMSPKDLFALLDQASDRGLIEAVFVRSAGGGHEKEVWQVTAEGMEKAGIAPTSPTSPTSDVGAVAEGGAPQAPTSPTSACRGVGGRSEVEVGA